MATSFFFFEEEARVISFNVFDGNGLLGHGKIDDSFSFEKILQCKVVENSARKRKHRSSNNSRGIRKARDVACAYFFCAISLHYLICIHFHS